MANSPNAETTPILYWDLVTNFNSAMPGATSIAVPRSGTLWVVYSYQGDRPAKRIYVQHQNGTTTQINPGENSVAVFAGDSLVYELYEDQSDSIKINFQLT